MKTTNPFRMFPLLLAAVLFASLTGVLQAADQFVQVTNPGWTNSSQYSWTGAWGDYDKDGFIDLFVPNTTASWAGWTNFLYHNNRDGTFTRQFADKVGSIASDKDPSAGGCWGDVNNDGFLDLLVVDFMASSSSPAITQRLYLNQGDGTFRSANAGDLAKPSYSGGWGGLTDYDNDGWLDVFVCAAWSESGHRTNLLYHGWGDGTFSLVTNTVVATDLSTYSNDAAWGDFDNDGLSDLLVANWDHHDFFYHNEGHGQFTRLTNSILEKYSSAHAAWGDYDNDGFLDLAAGYGSAARLFRNNGSGDFVVVTNWSTADSGAPVWADYDNDGYLDLLVIRGQGAGMQLRLFRNDGDGTFTQVEDVFTRPLANWIGGGWGDYDNDGFLDLFVAETNGKNALYHNLGNTNHWIKFQLEGVVANRTAIGAKVRVKATIGGKTVWQMREVSGGNFSQNDLRPNFGLGDATNVDLVRIEWPSGNVQEWTNLAPNQMLIIKEVVNITPANPSVSLNGSVTLNVKNIVSSASTQWQFEGVDLPGQTGRALSLGNIQASQAGRYSVVVTTLDQTVTNYVYLHVDPTFTKITVGPPVTDVGNSGACWGDYDGDGYPDLFVFRYKVGNNALYRNNGDGTFTSLPNPPFAQTNGVAWGATWADLDNDGKLDLVGVQEKKPTFIYFNNGDGTFAPKQFDTLTPWNLALADFDRDGFLDLYCSSYTDPTSRLYRNRGDRTFTRLNAQQVGPIVNVPPFGGGVWGDYDDDGWPDLYAGTMGANRRRLLFHNDGTGRFEPVTNLVTQFPAPAFTAAWGDYDNDGRLDLCVAEWPTKVYHNLGNGQFELATGTPTGNYNFAAWVDYDNDGFLDLFFTNDPGPNSLYHNNGDGTFSAVTTGSVVTDIPLGGGGTDYSTTEVAAYYGLWFDYDNDGFLDLYVPNGNDAGTAKAVNFLYHNNGNSNSWIKVKLVGTASNRDAVGAKVRIQARYAGQVRWQRRDITGGDSENGYQPYAHFGLGDATNVMALRIEWPSGAEQELTNVPASQSLTIWEPPALKAAIQEDGACELTVMAEPNRAWRIEASTDLQTWQPLAKVTNTTGTFGYTDSASTAMVCRFYRVVAE